MRGISIFALVVMICAVNTRGKSCSRELGMMQMDVLISFYESTLKNENFILVINFTCGTVEGQHVLTYIWDSGRSVYLAQLDSRTDRTLDNSLNAFEQMISILAQATDFLPAVLWNISGKQVLSKLNEFAKEFNNVVWFYLGPWEQLEESASALLCSTITLDMFHRTLSFVPPLSKDCARSRRDIELDSLLLEEKGNSLGHLFQFPDNNLRAIKLRVGVFSVKPYLDIESEQRCTTPTGGVFLHTLKTLAQFLNFRYEFVCTTGRFGSKNHHDDNWSGLMGLVQQKNVSFIMPLLPSDERAEYIEFSFPVVFDEIVFVTRKPEERSRALALVQPYTPEVWTYIGASIVVTSLVLSWISWKTSNVHTYLARSVRVQDSKGTPSPERYLNPAISAWYLFSTLTNQGGAAVLPANAQVRLVLGAWWLYALVVVTGYSGTLISFLNSPRLEQAVDDLDTLEHLINTETFVAGSGAGTSVQEYLEHSTSGPYYKLGKVARENPDKSQVANFRAGMDRVLKDGHYALISTRGTGQAAAIPHGLDNFHFGEERLSGASTSIGMNKGSPLREPIDHMLLGLHEAGLMDKWIDNYFDKFRAESEGMLLPESQKEERRLKERKSKPLSAKEMMGAYLIWAAGQIVAMVTFMLEILWSRSKGQPNLFAPRQSTRKNRRRKSAGVAH